jgi:hypothetical protein
MIVAALVAVCPSHVQAGSAALKRISRAVALTAVEASKAATENESVALAEVARFRLAVYFASVPDVEASVEVAPGYCGIVVYLNGYQVWGEASQGKLINGGVDYSQ